jgi:glycosyltransferase involved in cell wall biosynthesis
MAPLRVLHVRSTSGFYGAERVLETLLPELAHFDVRPSLCVLTAQRDSELFLRLSAAGVDAFEIDGRSGGRIARLRQLGAKMRGFSLVHTHDYLSAVSARVVAPANSALIGTVHGWTMRTAKLRLYAQMEQLAFRRFATVAVVDPNLAQRLEQRYRGRPAVEFVANAVDVNHFRPVQDSVAPRQGGTVFGCIGRLDREKGQRDLLEAFAAGKLAECGARLKFVGEGPDHEALRARAEELGVRDAVGFDGVRRDMAQVYAEIDCLVLPSLREGMPMVVLEALASGKPVVATEVGAVPLLLSSGCGLVVPVGDRDAMAAALRRIAQSAEERVRMGAAGRQLVESNYSPRHQAGRYAQIYRTASQGAGTC